MNHSLKITALLATSLACGGCATQAAAPAPPQAPPEIETVMTSAADALHLEAEAAQLSGPQVLTKRAGYSGTGYVSGFAKDDDKISWTLNVPNAGIYLARVRYSAPFGAKGTALEVNGAKTSVMLPETKDVFATASLGKVELKKGENSIAINKGWGYYDIDALDLVPVTVEQSLARPPATLVDVKATPQARDLMKFLVEQYGKETLSGQFEIGDNDYITEKTGVVPAVFGGDLMDYSPSRVERGAKADGKSEKYLERAKMGQITTLTWHWNAPSKLTQFDADGKEIKDYWWGGFYTKNTTFDLQAALDDPNSEDYQLLMRDIDVIAVELKKFDAAGVPVLWRPLHEAEGGWFWWGAKGPEPFKKLWRIMYDRLTQKHDLHNLIWVYTTAGNADWYPGDDVVDVIGADAYSADYRDPLTGLWDDLNAQYGGRKLITLSEVGKVPDVAKMRRLGVKWSYFNSWTGDLGPKGVPASTLKIYYNAPGVMNLGELSALQSAQVAAPKVATQSVALGADGVAYFPPTALEYNALAEQTQDNLQRQILQKWFPAAVNRERGGFDQNFAADWTKLPGSERSIVYQSRLTWTAAQAAMRLSREEFIYRNHTRHGVAFLRDTMWDAGSGGFFWQIDNGIADRNGEKHVYGNAFAIYALSAAYRAIKDPDALRLAQQDFLWLEKHAHDDKNGGYFEALRRDGTPIMAPPSPDQQGDFIGTHYGYKSMNAHIHLLEAYGALYEVWPNPQLKTRLNELFELVRDRIAVEPGVLNQFFTPDWRPIPADDSYGHDIETAYLLTEAAHILGRDNDSKARRIARDLVDHTLDIAFDQERGGIANDGGVWGNIVNPDKVWWSQAEALNAMLLMHELYGTGPNADRRYWDAFVKQWDFIRNYQIDAENGGWYSFVKNDGTPPPANQVKSDRWTESYHQGRALMNVTETLQRLAKGEKRK